jgi:hypothetical protein
MTLEAYKFRVLKLLSRRNVITIGKVKEMLLGTKLSSEQLIESLQRENLIEIEENKIRLNQHGQTYVKKEEFETNEIVHEGLTQNFNTALFEYLYSKKFPINLEDFPQILVDAAPKYNDLIGYGRLQQALYSQQALIEHIGNKWYLLKESGRSIHEKNVANKSKQEKREEKKDQILDLTIDDLVDKVIDQPKVKGRLRRTEVVATLSALAAIGSLLVMIAMWKGCK